MVLGGRGCLLVLAVIGGSVALHERGNARAQATAADAQRLGAQALAEDDLDRSLLLARQGVALDDSPQTRSNLLAALLKSPAAIGVVRADGGQLVSLDLSRDGRTLALLDDSGTLTFVDPQTRHQVGQPYNALGPELVPGSDDVRFSPDGSRVAVGWQRSGRRGRSHPSPARPDCASSTDRYVSALRFSPDGRTLFAVVGFTTLTTCRRRPSSASTRAAAGRSGRRAVTSHAGRSASS